MFPAPNEVLTLLDDVERAFAVWADMLPAMNPAEHAGTFPALKGGASEPVFTAALQLAERVLDAQAWEALKSSLDVAREPSFRAA
jgi:hypothetical protein